jgi:hypothetical protein
MTPTLQSTASQLTIPGSDVMKHVHSLIALPHRDVAYTNVPFCEDGRDMEVVPVDGSNCTARVLLD